MVICHKCWLDIYLPPTSNGSSSASFTHWRNNTGHALIKSIELKIGGSSIDKQSDIF